MLDEFPSWDDSKLFSKDFRSIESIGIKSVRKHLKKSLSKRRRANSNLRKLNYQRRIIQSEQNMNLMVLDLHEASIIYDKRNLNIINIGMAQLLEDASYNIAAYQRNSDKQFEEQKNECLQQELELKTSLKQKYIELQEEAEKKKAQVVRIEKEARNTRDLALRYQHRYEEYRLFCEWQKLNEEYQALSDEMENLNKYQSPILQRLDKKYPSIKSKVPRERIPLSTLNNVMDTPRD